MERWAPTLVVALIALLQFAATYGAFGRTLKDHDRRIDGLEHTRGEQWEDINELKVGMGQVQTRLEMQPPHSKANGRGAGA